MRFRVVLAGVAAQVARGSKCHANATEGRSGVAAQVARSLPIRVRSLVMPTGQVRMSRTRRLHATKSSIRPYTDTSSDEQSTACKSFFFRWHRAHTCRRHRLRKSDGRHGRQPLPRVVCEKCAAHRPVMGAAIANKESGYRHRAGPLEPPPLSAGCSTIRHAARTADGRPLHSGVHIPQVQLGFVMMRSESLLGP